MSRAALSAYDGLKELGHVPAVLCIGEGELSRRLRRKGIEHVVVHAPPAKGFVGDLPDKLRAATSLRGWEDQVLGILPDLPVRPQEIAGVHVIRPNHLGLAGRIARRLDVPAVWEMPSYVRPAMTSRLWYQTQCSIYPIRAVAGSQAVVDSFGKIPRRASLQAYGANPGLLSAVPGAQARSELGIGENEAVFTFIARLTPLKGHHAFLRGLRHIETHVRTEMRLLIVGDGDESYRRWIAAEADDLGVRVTFSGYVDDVGRYLSASDVLVNLTSVPEAFGVTVVEAMHLGVPVLAHASGGPAETVVDGVTGWHVCDVAEPTVAGGIQRCLSDRVHWETMGEAARTRSASLYTHTAHAERLLAQYGLSPINEAEVQPYPAEGMLSHGTSVAEGHAGAQGGKRVVACLATTGRRPDGLVRCVASLAEQDIRPDHVVLAWNRKDPPPTGLVRMLEGTLGTTSLSLVHEPRVGIPFARNAGVGEALQHGAHYIVMLDDDEFAPRDWLANHLKALGTTGTDVSTGPFRSELAPEAVGRVASRAPIFQANSFAPGSPRPYALTNNLVARAKVFQDQPRWFDEQLAGLGGSDAEFFSRVVAAGGVIRWTPEAEVIETVPEHRVTLRWVFKRKYRYGNLTSWRERNSGVRRRVLRFGRGCSHVAAGVAGGFRAGVSRDVDGALTALERASAGVGMLTGALGWFNRRYV